MNIFDDVKLGLEQAIEYEQGKTEATERVILFHSHNYVFFAKNNVNIW